MSFHMTRIGFGQTTTQTQRLLQNQQAPVRYETPTPFRQEDVLAPTSQLLTATQCEAMVRVSADEGHDEGRNSMWLWVLIAGAAGGYVGYRMGKGIPLIPGM